MPARKPIDSGIAGALFSRVRQRVLSILFFHHDRGFQASEIIQLAKSGSGAVQRELERLAAAGIVSVSYFGKRKLYQVNQAGPIFNELRDIIRKTVGLREPVAEALQRYRSKINLAFIYGSTAKGTDKSDSDIDLMVVSDDLSYSEVFSAVQRAEKVLARPINPTILTRAEWSKRLAQKGSFLHKVVQQPKLFVIGSDNDLERIG